MTLSICSYEESTRGCFSLIRVKYFPIIRQILLYLYPYNRTEKENNILILKRLSL